jgi:hypothetical protein
VPTFADRGGINKKENLEEIKLTVVPVLSSLWLYCTATGFDLNALSK